MNDRDEHHDDQHDARKHQRIGNCRGPEAQPADRPFRHDHCEEGQGSNQDCIGLQHVRRSGANKQRREAPTCLLEYWSELTPLRLEDVAWIMPRRINPMSGNASRMGNVAPTSKTAWSSSLNVREAQLYC